MTAAGTTYHKVPKYFPNLRGINCYLLSLNYAENSRFNFPIDQIYIQAT